MVLLPCLVKSISPRSPRGEDREANHGTDKQAFRTLHITACWTSTRQKYNFEKGDLYISVHSPMIVAYSRGNSSILHEPIYITNFI